MPDRCLLYYITDRAAFPGDESARRRRLLEKISEAARAGVDFIQLREKDLSTRELESLAREAVSVMNQLRTENREVRTRLLINSRTDVALAAGADGVHLRSDDVSPKDVRAIWKQYCAGARELPVQSPLIGVSCHSAEEVAQAAANSASFAVFAPVFEKKGGQDKDVGTPHLASFARRGNSGLTLLKKACQENIPVLALGGITLANAQSCLEAGAAGLAAIRLFQENDIAQIVLQLKNL